MQHGSTRVHGCNTILMEVKSMEGNNDMAVGGVAFLQEVFLSLVVILLAWLILKVSITRLSRKR